MILSLEPVKISNLCVKVSSVFDCRKIFLLLIASVHHVQIVKLLNPGKVIRHFGDGDADGHGGAIKLSYQGSCFHRVIDGFMIQGMAAMAG
jgi:cyclophilin family peptidyl-prolyl cis-trans isomerase